jgi:dUTP pyrophosphatase
MYLKFRKSSPTATTPQRATRPSAGIDLFSAENITVPAKGKALINTNIAIDLPSDHFGHILPRSSLAWNNFITVGCGVIDPDYKGDLYVCLYNLSDTDYIVNVGDRIAQLLIIKFTFTTLIQSEFTTVSRDVTFNSILAEEIADLERAADTKDQKSTDIINIDGRNPIDLTSTKDEEKPRGGFGSTGLREIESPQSPDKQEVKKSSELIFIEDDSDFVDNHSSSDTVS